MAGIADFLSGSSQAAIDYRNALNQSKNTINSLFRSYGFTMPNASGGYDVNTAQGAFDPNKLFNTTTGAIDNDAVRAMAGSMSYDGTGRLADIARAGAGDEANVLLGLKQSGLKGGLASQRRGLAEQMAAKQMGGAKEEFLLGVAGAYNPLGDAYQTANAAMIADNAAAEKAAAEAAATPVYQDPAAAAPATGFQGYKAGDIVPTNNRGNYSVRGTPGGHSGKPGKPGEVFVGKQGVTWVYRPSGPNGPGWYKKGG